MCLCSQIQVGFPAKRENIFPLWHKPLPCGDTYKCEKVKLVTHIKGLYYFDNMGEMEGGKMGGEGRGDCGRTLDL